MESKRQWIATNRLKTVTLFRSLFPGNDELANAIGNHMREHGYDESQPIIVWDRSEDQGRNAFCVVDGHTRLVAAKLIGFRRNGIKGIHGGGVILNSLWILDEDYYGKRIVGYTAPEIDRRQFRHLTPK